MISITTAQVTPQIVNTGDNVVIKIGVDAFLTWLDAEKVQWETASGFTWGQLEGS